MNIGRPYTHGFVFGSFLVASVVAASLPTRERQIYDYDCVSQGGGLVTRIVGTPTLGLDRRSRSEDPYAVSDCWPESGLVAGRFLDGSENYVSGPTRRIARTVGRSGNLVDGLRRTQSRSTTAGPPASIGEEVAALLPQDPAPETASPGGRQFAMLSAAPNPGFPGGLAIGPFGPTPGGGGIVPSAPPISDPGPTPTPTPTNPPTGEVPPSIPPVPEPSTWLLLIMGFFGIGAAVRRRSGLAALKPTPAA